MTAFVDVDGFALLCNYSPQHARRVFRDGVEGKSWNGNRLTIVVSDCRGGASGKQYLVAIDSLPPDLQQKAKSLDLPLRKPVARPSHGEIADWQHDEANFRLTVLLPIIPTASGSSERAAAIREVAQNIHHTPKGKAERFSERTIRNWLAAYEKGGFAGLVPQPSPVRGQRRVLISRAWDQSIDLDDAVRAEIAEKLEKFARSATAKGMSFNAVARFSARELRELSRLHGSRLDDRKLQSICGLTKKWAGRFAEAKRLYVHDFDNKLWDDKHRPRISRKLSEWPLDVVYSDVHPIDIYKQLPDDQKRQIRLRLIGWLDHASQYFWGTVVALGPGNGVRKPDVAVSLHHMMMDPHGGLPGTFIFDNGGENNDVASAIKEFPEISNLMAGRGIIDFGGRRSIRTTPYQGASKPIEGTFKTLEQNFFRFIPGWIGGERTNKKTHQVGKPVEPYAGSIEELIGEIHKAIAAYNDTPQPEGKLAGLSPRDAMANAIERGWVPQKPDTYTFDEVFSERDIREVRQGRFSIGGKHFSSDATHGMGHGTKVEVRKPLRPGLDYVFIRKNGHPLGIARQDEEYDATDGRGAIEVNRRIKTQKAAIAALRQTVDPSFNAFAEITRGVDTTPLTTDATIIRLTNQKSIGPASGPDTDGEDDDRRWREIMQAREKARASGGTR